MRFISTRAHAVIDYLSVLALLIFPHMQDWDRRVVMTFTIVAIGVLIISVLTRYELGAAKLLPMKAHLVLDFLAGAALLAMAWQWGQWGDEPGMARRTLAAVGLFEIVMSLVTRSRSSWEEAHTAAEARERPASATSAGRH